MPQTSASISSIFSNIHAVPNIGEIEIAGFRPTINLGSWRINVTVPEGISWRFQLMFRPDAYSESQAFDWVPQGDWLAGSAAVVLPIGAPGMYDLHVDLKDETGQVAGLWVGQTRAVEPALFGQVAIRAAQRLVARDQAWNPPPSRDLKQVANLDELAARLRLDAQVYGAELSQGMPWAPADLLLATAATLRIGRLYDFGLEDPNVPGCVLSGPKSGHPKTCGEFLAAPFGCCHDFSAILAKVLGRFGLANRPVSMLDDHIFNEVCVDDRWYALDPTVMAVYDRDYASILRSGGEVFLWPLSCDGPGFPAPRAALQALRLSILLAPELRHVDELLVRLADEAYADVNPILETPSAPFAA